MDDVLKRLSNVEGSVSEIRAQVSALSASASHFATKGDLSKLEAQMSGLAATIPHFATKSDLSKLESSLIKWILSTFLAVAVLTFTIARFVKFGG